MRWSCILLLPAVLAIVSGCAMQTIAVDLTATGHPSEAFEGLDRFAMIHSPTGNHYSRQLARQTVGALGMYVKQRGYQSHASQQPLTVSRDDNEMIHRLGAMAVRSFGDAGYQHDRLDPKFVVGVEFATGPFDYHVPAASNRRERVHAHAVLMHIYDVRQPDQPIWQGTAIAVSGISDFARVAPLLVEQLADTYPAVTPPIRRTVTLEGMMGAFE